MKKVAVVIGSNFGDEGKGLMTDFFASFAPKKSLVVRFNGGAQAGHTVAVGDRRHVFHHFGSGTLCGSDTYLGPKFLVNPMVFMTEYQDLMHEELLPRVFVHPRARLSTPWDAIINQELEKARGDDRHGSCGLGIWETELRSQEYELLAEDMFRPMAELEDKLDQIRYIWTPNRMKACGLKVPEIVGADGLFRHFLDDVYHFTKVAKLAEWDEKFLVPYDRVIFEGAQGLRLDQDSRYTPHVSGSSTGLRNVVPLAETGWLADTTMEVVYVTRPYITRHGAGPLPHELTGAPYPEIEDRTNITNEWQGSLRFGLFDVDEFLEFVQEDMKHAMSHRATVFHLAMTCTDQLGPTEQVRWFQRHKKMEGNWRSLFRELIVPMKSYDGLYSNGPTRHNVRWF